ncbi:MAG: PAS domain S-box protein [Alkalispirochaetaceae bacterium]
MDRTERKPEAPASEELRTLQELYTGSSGPLLFRAVLAQDGTPQLDYLSRLPGHREPEGLRPGSPLTTCSRFLSVVTTLRPGESAILSHPARCGDGSDRLFIYRLRLIREEGGSHIAGAIEPADRIPGLPGSVEAPEGCCGNPGPNDRRGAGSPGHGRRGAARSADSGERRQSQLPEELPTVMGGLSDRRKLHRQLLGAVIQAPISIMITDPDGSIIYVNPFFEATTGYTGAEVRGKNPRFLKSGANDPALYRELWECVLAGETWQGELVNRRKDGSEYRERAVITPIVESDGSVSAIVGLKQNVTAEYEAAEGLRNEERRFHSLFANAGDGILIHGFDGIIQDANPAAGRQTGYTREELIGLPVGALDVHFTTAPPEAIKSIMSGDCGTGESVRLATTVRRKDGSVFPAEVTVYLISREGGGRLGVSVRDISERESAISALAESESRFSGLIRTAPIGILFADARGTILEANSALSALLRLSKHRRLTGANLMHSPVLRKEGISGFFSQCLASNEPGELEHTYRSPSGRTLLLRIIAKSVVNRAGQTVGLLAIIEDITQRRRDQEALTRSLREKELLIQELNHRVKNNLQSVSSLLRLQMNSLETEKDRALFESNLSRIDSMAMVHQMLYGSDDLESIDFVGYLRELSLYARAGTGAHCRVEVLGSAYSVSIAQAVPLGLLVNELLANSIKHSVGDDPWVQITTRKEGCRGYLSIQDSGPADASKIYPGHSGFGLGLVSLLASQVGAHVVPKPGPGFRMELMFDLPGSGASPK